MTKYRVAFTFAYWLQAWSTDYRFLCHQGRGRDCPEDQNLSRRQAQGPGGRSPSTPIIRDQRGAGYSVGELLLCRRRRRHSLSIRGRHRSPSLAKTEPEASEGDGQVAHQRQANATRVIPGHRLQLDHIQPQES